ncbi:MAG: methionine--tRNA ligase [Candidatus Thermoplasmatota archaeon]
MGETIYIGVAWPYANGSLHLGHIAGCYLPADIFARFNRLKGNEVLMVSGSDEHGTPVTITAEKENTTPKKIVDKYNKQHTENMEQLGISFDCFTRTTTKNHKEVVQDIFLTLSKKGYIYEKQVESFYCENCDRFLPDRYIEGECPYCGYEESRGDQCDECGKILESENLKNVKCKICGGIPEIRSSKHLFFALSKFEDKLLNWLEEKNHWKKNVLKFTKNWLKEGLKDRGITRDMKWGIEVPIEGFEDKRIYVWFDAVIGYLAASKEWAKKQGKEDKWKEWWINSDAKHYYFLAKDNIPFHSIIWPSILMGYNKELNLPHDIPANEYLRLEGKQFSKSRGLAIWVPDILKKLDVDAVRYYLSINMPEKRDSNWMWKDFVKKNNNELVGAYGNFIHRVLTFTSKNFEEIPEQHSLNPRDKEVINEIKKVSKEASNSIESCEFKKGLRSVMNLAQIGNSYFNDMEPWNLIKDDKDRCKTVLNVCLKIVKALAVFTSPYLPFSSDKVWKILGEQGSVHDASWDDAFDELQTGSILKKPKPLFKKLSLEDFMPEEEEAEEEKDPFSKIDLRVAKILDVKNHPNADKLYILQVDVGIQGKKVLVAGMKPYYSIDELKGKKIVIVSNLAPAKIRGVKSNGMLLAAEDKKEVVSLLDPGDAEVGSKVYAEGIERKPVKTLSFDEFQEIKMKVNKDLEAVYNGKNLKVEDNKIVADKKVEENAEIL